MYQAFSTRVARHGYGAAVLGLLAFLPLGTIRAQDEVLTNATIVQMVAGKLSRDLIVSKINTTTPGFDVSSSGIVYLWTNKVDDRVIKVMLDLADTTRQKGKASASLTGLDEVMNNDAVVKMVTAHVPKQIILAKIRMSRSAYDVTAAGMVNLKANKVPEDVIKVMMSPPPPPAAAAPIPIREAPNAAAPPPATKTASADTTKKAPPKKPAAKPPVKKPPL